jgi:hypothetical protein
MIAWPKALQEGDWKLVMEVGPELYHISQDRNEEKNLAAEFPERVQAMTQRHGELFSPR